MKQNLIIFRKWAVAFSAAFFITSLLNAAGNNFVWEDFELGASYWAAGVEGGAMSGGLISPDFPSHGKFGYRGRFSFPKGGGKADFTTHQVGDLTGGTALTLDVYNSSKTPMTLMMVVKQGSAWLWCQSPEKDIKPGWTKDVVFDLTTLQTATGKTLKDLAQMMQLSLIFQSKEAGDGYLYIDNLRLAGADPNKVVMVRAEEMAAGSPVTITGFEDGT